MYSKQIAIAWADLTYNVKPFFWSSQKKILNQLFGSIEFGSVTALMGPSGAGKTTLLNCINGKISEGLDTNTKIYLNKDQKIRSSFVGQHEREHLILCLTTKENLLFASKVKNSGLKSETGSIDHNKNVMAIMDELLISDISDTRVEYCSGGQQKRLTIALEMTRIIKPNILCIDEPTTGLDSNIALIVMQCLRRLAKNYNISIITSIHQPNNEIVLMFDKLYVLSKGGHCLFSGCPDQINTFLTENQISYNENQIPVEQLLKLASIDTKEDYIEDIIERTRESLSISVINECKDQTKLSSDGLKIRSKIFKFQDFWYLMLRLMKIQYVRQWRALLFQFSFYVFFAISACKMFNKDIGKPSGCFNPEILNTTCIKELEDDSLLYQNQNFLFFISLMNIFTHLCLATLAFATDVKIFNYEHQNGWYSTGSYFFARSFVEFIPTVIMATIYSFLIYYGSAQPFDRERVVGYILVIVLGFLTAESVGHIIGILLQNYPSIAIMGAIGSVSSMCTLSNYYILIAELPNIFQIFSDFCYPKYIFNSGLILVYGLNRCLPEESSVVLLKFTLNDENLFENYNKLLIYILVSKVLSFIALYLRTETRIRLKFPKKNNTNKQTLNETIEMKTNDKNDEKHINMKMSIHANFSNENGVQIEDNVEKKQSKQMCIIWKDLTLCIPKTMFSDQKVILKQINGFFEFQSLNALMGSSGAGKTSLLKSINGLYNEYITNDSIIMLSKSNKIKTCFITQNVKDHILTGLTARQAMIYASKLKNNIKDFDHKKNVETIMSELLISNTFDTNVERCSGGEQKRLVIAMELTASLKPNLLCIDEPTSGLDSNAAEVVIKCLKKLSVNHNICVITSIHQPNNDILMMFDKLYVLSKDGHCVYSDRPQQIGQHLFDCGIQLTKNEFPIEVLLKYSCNDLSDTTVEKLVKKSNQSELECIECRESDETTIHLDGIKRVSKRFYLRDLGLLLKRGFTYNVRFYWKISLFQLVIHLVFALFLRLLYKPEIGNPSGCISFDDDFNNTCAKTPAKIEEDNQLNNNMKFNFYVMICVVFFTITATLFSFVLDLKMFINEQRNGWYSTGAYYWSKTIIELIPLTIILICFSYCVDIYESKNSMFVEYLIFLTIGALQSQSFGQVVGILTQGNARTGVFTLVGAFVFSFMFCNILIPIKELHYSLQFVSNFVTLKLLFESIMILFYGFGRCSDREFSFPLFLLDIDDNDLYFNLYLLVIQFFLFRAIALMLLLIKVDPFVTSKKDREIRRQITEQMNKEFTSKEISMNIIEKPNGFVL